MPLTSKLTTVLQQLAKSQTQPLTPKELEAKLSKFHKMDDTILYTSCYDANVSLF